MNAVNRFILLTLLISVSFISHSRELTMRIEVKDNADSPLPGATVHMTRASDSVRVSTITDLQGVARFERLEQGPYIVNISFVGYEPLERTIMVRNGQSQVSFRLSEDVQTLGEVTVVARRPLIRQEDDRMIIDPEPMAAISTNTLEILESTPGLFVDQDGGIFLNSATPATVYINGREQKMSNQDINTILRSLPPGSLQRIEVIRTPSARFAASSSGGIINVVLKRGVKIGRFGSLTTGMNQGFYGNQFLGVSFNNSGDRTTSYVNLNYNSNNSLEELNSDRFLMQDATLSQVARTRRSSHQGYLGYGMGYEISERTNFNYDGRINGSLPASLSRNNNFINGIDDLPISQTFNLVENDSRFLSLQQDLGLMYKIDSLGSEWDTKFSYSMNLNNTLQDYRNEWLLPASTMISGAGDNFQQRHFFQMQSDLTWRLPFAINLETGVSSSYQVYTSDADFTINNGGTSIADPLRTNAFNYNENINAGYLQFARTFPFKIMLKTGLRLEHTFMQGNQVIPSDTSFVVNRADLFPYVYLSRPVFSIEGFNLQAFLIYRRTITRPGYQSLNPYINIVDEFLYETGNPALKPQFADNFEANISFNDFPIFAVGRNYTTDIFTGVVYRDPVNENIAVRTFDNLGQSTETYFRAMAGIPPGRRYFFAIGTQYNHNDYNGLYENQPFAFSRGSWRFFTFHNLRLGPDTRLTMSGFMMTRGQMNFYELETFGMLNFGLNQTFLNKRLTVTLNARDVLGTMRVAFELNQGGIRTSGNRYTDTQRFGVNVRYNFGIPRRQERQNMFQFENVETP